MKKKRKSQELQRNPSKLFDSDIMFRTDCYDTNRMSMLFPISNRGLTLVPSIFES